VITHDIPSPNQLPIGANPQNIKGIMINNVQNGTPIILNDFGITLSKNLKTYCNTQTVSKVGNNVCA